MIYLELFLGFLQVGLFSFGGAYGAIPLIREVVLRNGWLEESYKEVIKKAFLGLIKYKIDKDGNIFDVCRGSGNSMDEAYYMNLGVIENDDHGTGIILMALAEMARIFEDGDFL